MEWRMAFGRVAPLSETTKSCSQRISGHPRGSRLAWVVNHSHPARTTPNGDPRHVSEAGTDSRGVVIRFAYSRGARTLSTGTASKTVNFGKPPS
jgi:hypothetical protein